MSNTKPNNPYPGRPYPVGQLEYPCRNQKLVDSIKRYCLLEYGEPEVLFDIPRLLGFGGNYLNLGHGAGGSTLLLAAGLADQKLSGIVHSVDFFNKNDGLSPQQALKVIEPFGFKDCVVLHQGKTTDFADTFEGMKFSFLFIDAGHGYEDVKHDFLTFSPLVKVGGMVAFHDTNQEPSNRVIQEHVKNSWQQILHVNRIKVFKRT